MTCDECGREIAYEQAAWYEVVGYERHRSQGGTNAVAMRKRTGKAICGPCMVSLKAGIAPGQGQLSTTEGSSR